MVETSALLDAVQRTMGDAGLDHVPEETLEQPVPGRLTEMDRAPATVRDVLFCEVC